MPEQSELPQQKGKQTITSTAKINNRKEQNIMICKRLTAKVSPVFPI